MRCAPKHAHTQSLSWHSALLHGFMVGGELKWCHKPLRNARWNRGENIYSIVSGARGAFGVRVFGVACDFASMCSKGSHSVRAFFPWHCAVALTVAAAAAASCSRLLYYTDECDNDVRKALINYINIRCSGGRHSGDIWNKNARARLKRDDMTAIVCLWCFSCLWMSV